METITVTFGDRAENHVGMEIIGTKLENNSFLTDLDKFHEYYLAGYNCEQYDISQNIAPAEILIVRNFAPNHKKLMEELRALDWDRKAKMYGRVCEKRIRYNLIFADFEQEPDYEKGKGRVYDFADLPLLSSVRQHLEQDLQEVTGREIPIVGEGNYYYNNKCCINYHGDTERKMVIGLRLGSPMRLLYQWHKKKETYGKEMEFTLNPGDLYIMSSKAIGNDWKYAAGRYSKGKRQYALRHAAKF